MADDNKNKVAKEQLQKNNNKTNFNNVVINNSIDDNLSRSLNSWQNKKQIGIQTSTNSVDSGGVYFLDTLSSKKGKDKNNG